MPEDSVTFGPEPTLSQPIQGQLLPVLGPNRGELIDYLPDVQAWNPAHASWSDRWALFCFDQLIRLLTSVLTDSLYRRIGHVLKPPDIQIKGVTSFLKPGVARLHSQAARHYSERAKALNPLNDLPQGPQEPDRP
jgi:hypothetical protein